MSIASCVVKRPVAAGLILFLAIPLAQASAEGPLNGAPQPAAVRDDQAQAQTPAPAPDQTQQQAPASSLPAQQDQQPQPSGSGKPVGTAAAPVERTTGVTASRPAGAVIAPAKQRRARSILIRVGIVAAAAAAIGIVIGASKASNSQPN